jgi:hypothetical protein
MKKKITMSIRIDCEDGYCCSNCKFLDRNAAYCTLFEEYLSFPDIPSKEYAYKRCPDCIIVAENS